MAKEFSRKDLKQQDEFTRGATSIAQWMMQRRKSIGLGLLIVVAGVSVLLGVRSYRQRQESDAAALLAVALRVYNSPIEAAASTQTAAADEHEAAGHLHFTTEAEKFQAALEALQPVIAEFGSYPSGRAASFYRGSALASLGRMDEAETALLAAADASAPLVRAMALQRLGDLYIQSERPEDAVQLFDRLIANPPQGFPVEEALTAKARAHEAAGDAQAAMVAYQRVSEEFESSVYAMPARLRAEEIAARLGVDLDAES